MCPLEYCSGHHSHFVMMSILKSELRNLKGHGVVLEKKFKLGNLKLG